VVDWDLVVVIVGDVGGVAIELAVAVVAVGVVAAAVIDVVNAVADKCNYQYVVQYRKEEDK